MTKFNSDSDKNMIQQKWKP